MNTADIREAFLSYFEAQGHTRVDSSSLVPANDPTLLFTNAGMNQFKEAFLGLEQRPYVRAVTAQKCVRAGGKHNDLENVGYTARHHTFFEMLGNFSFGDYFKREAIQFAWEFLTGTLALPPDRLWITVHISDDEAAQIWVEEIGIDPARLSRLDEDNFWQMGDTGPCGPCSEVFYDHGPDVPGGPPGSEDDDLDRYIEIWNLVFMQYNRDASGELHPLPAPSVDTGMGLERIAAVLQHVHSNYEIDLFTQLIKAVADQLGLKETDDKSLRVIADHLRSSAFLIADGVLPGNEGRGYVLRRIIRRAIRHGNKLGADAPFFAALVPALLGQMGEAYPQLKERATVIVNALQSEEEQFARTLDNGMAILEEALAGISDTLISGEVIFKLYDTYGFPVDLTNLILEERGFNLDIESFNSELEKQKDRSRKAAEISFDDWMVLIDDPVQEFVGYDSLEANVKIVKYRKVKSKKDGIIFQLVFNLTPFYAESGGQIGDIGFIESNDGDVVHIHDTIKEGSLSIHLTKNLPKKLDLIFRAVVDSKNRFRIQCNHTATHLLHQALRNILGNHVEQKGSRVSSENFRFDFSHYSKLNQSDIISVENFVNSRIENSIDLIEERNVPLKKAQDNGAIGLFGEKYGDTVRTIKFGASYELCGGTHVNNTSELWQFKIISEGAIASGIRRIEAITNESVKNYYNSKINEYDKIKDILKNPKSLYESIKSLSEENSLLKKEIDKLSNEKVFSVKKDIITKLENISGLNVITTTVDLKPAKIKDLCFSIASEMENLFLIIITKDLNKVYCSCYISKNLVSEKNLNSSEIISKLSKFINGRGGGQAFYSTCAGDNLEGIQKLFTAAKDLQIQFLK